MILKKVTFAGVDKWTSKNHLFHYLFDASGGVGIEIKDKLVKVEGDE